MAKLLLLAGAAGPALAAGAPADGGSKFPPFEASTFPSQLFWLAVTFGLLYILMSRVALPRVGAILEQRREAIDGALRAASAAQKEAEEQANALETSLAKARASAQGIAGEARDKSSKEIEARRAAVEKDLSAKLVAAEARITETKSKAMGNVETIAKDAVSTILEQLGSKATDAAIAKAISAVKA
ncbi:MAG: F0F1 ATP synthase subunit B' [Rhizobiales bacterium]|nr:F0F1 ATP synthase subunit B' [Hyphomicrobiales bacterium]